MEPVTFDMIVRLSNDESFQKGVSTVFNNDHDNSSGLGAGTDKEYWEVHEGKLIAVESLPARFVRIHSNRNTSDNNNHYLEIDVYGVPVKR